MILPELLIISSYLFVSSSCREFHDYDYENSPNSVKFGAPSHTPIFNNINKTNGGVDGNQGYKPGYMLEYKPEYKAEYKPEYKLGYKLEYKPEYKPGYRPGYKNKKCLLPPLKSIKIYQCEDWSMECEYRPSQVSQYSLHCKFVAGTSEDF